MDNVSNTCTIRSRCIATVMMAGSLGLLTTVHTVQAQSQTTVQPVVYSDSYGSHDRFRFRIYGGVGIGKSWLEPDTSEVPGTDPNKRVNNGGQLMLGADVNKWVSVEGHASTLGDAGLSPSGTIAYETYGLSALLYTGKNRHRFNRSGLSAFGRIGYGYLKNEPSAGLRFRQVNSSHLLMGAGVEYAMRNGLGLRGEGILFDTDVRYGQLSLLYRFGKPVQRRREALVEAPKLEPTPTPVVTPVPAIAIAPMDSDADGVNDSIDQCPTTQTGVAVDQVGCDLFAGVIEGVNFNSGSADLTNDARTILSSVVNTLQQYPHVGLSIMAHTDSQGDNGANKQLSKQRARSVAVYLVRGGVSAKRLRAYGFGEDRPIASNDTEEGRLRNRRVEFRASQ